MIKKITALAIVAMMLMTAAACAPAANDVVDIVMPTPEPMPEIPRLALTVPELAGYPMAAAGALHSLGLRSDGTVIAAGHDTKGQCAVSDWKDMRFIAAGGEISAGVKSDGTVLLAGDTEAVAAAGEWTNIAALAVGRTHIAGLKADGTVVAAGAAGAALDVSAWSGIVAIAAGEAHTAGLRADGTVVAAGDNSAGQCDVSDWSEITAISASAKSTVGLKADGTVISTDESDLSSFKDIVYVSAGDSVTVGITKAGAVISTCADDCEYPASGAAMAAAGGAHALIVNADGSMTAFGNNDDFQCEVKGWKLCPYNEGDAVLGFMAGDNAAHVKKLMSHILGADSVSLKRDGAELPDDGTIATGVEIYADNALCGVIAIRGDTDGSGVIDMKDAELVKKHLDGDEELSGAYLAAASVNVNSVGKLLKSSYDAVMAGNIDQFRPAGEQRYAEKIAGAYAKNDDVVGWISIAGTNIDYPILYKDNWYYADHDSEGESATSGSVYPFFNQYAQMNIVTAHNSRVSKTMFHQLHHVQEYNMALKEGKTGAKCAYEKCSAELTGELPDFSTYAGRVFRVSLYGVEANYEIFSMYEQEAPQSDKVLYYNTWFPVNKYWCNSDEEINEWVDKQISRSDYDFGVSPDSSDTFMVIYTCANEHRDSSEGARLYYFLHRVD